MWYENAAGGLLLIAPGYLLALLLLPPKKAGERLSAFEGLCFTAAFSVLVTSVVSHLLAAAGRFSGANLYSTIAIVSVLLAGWLLATKRSFLPFVFRASDVAPTLLIAALAVIYYPPAEFIWGSGDEGVYSNAGLEIAQRGGSLFRDEVLVSLPRGLHGANFGSYCEGFYFFEENDKSGLIVPHGFHLLPSFLAALHAAGGLTLFFAGPILLALVSVGAFYLLVARFAGPVVGVIAAVLLGINPASVWFARMTNAEIMVEAFLLTGFAFAVLAIPTKPATSSREPASGSRLFAAGVFFGAVHLAKIEFFLLPWALLLYILIMMVAGYRARTIAALPLGYGLFLALATFHAFHGHRVYFGAQLFNKEMYSSKNAIGYLGSFVLAIGLTFFVFEKRDLVVGWIQRLPLRRMVVWTGAVGMIAAVYLYWGLPLQSEWGGVPQSELSSWQRTLAVPHDVVVDSTERTWREITFPALGLYLSTLGVFCGMSGSFLLLARRDCVTLAPLLCFVLVQTAFVLLVSGSLDYGSAHPHAPGRRFLTTSIPGLIAAAILPWFVFASGTRVGVLLRIAGFALCAYLMQFTLRIGLPFIRNPTHTTTVEVVRDLAKNAPEDVVWITMPDDPMATHFLNPLRFFCQQKVFVLSPHIDLEEVDPLLAEFHEQGWTPMLLTGDDHPNSSPAKLRLIEVLGPKGGGTFEGRQYTVSFQRHRIPRDEDFSWWPPILRFYGGPPRL